MPQVGDIGSVRLQVGSVDLSFRIRQLKNGRYAWTRKPSPPLKPLPAPFFHFEHFGDGCGAFRQKPGVYGIAVNADCRAGYIAPGPREVADMTGIAAGYRVRKVIKHGDVNMAITYNGTDSRVYREEASAWVLKETVAGAAATDITSFKDVVAVGYGPSTAYRFSSDDGGTWTASTKTGNAKYANRFLRQITGLANPRVRYFVNPNLSFWTEDLTNTDAVGSTGVTFEDTATDQQFFTSATVGNLGEIVVGMRHALFRLDPDDIVVKLTDDYPDPPADAGSQGDRDNFEAYAEIKGRLYYVVKGYEIIEYFNGRVVNEQMAPYHQGPLIPRMHLPINAILALPGNYLMVAQGTTTPSTLKNVANYPGITALLANTFGSTSDIYLGRYEERDGVEKWVWHGSILETTDSVRYAWLDEDDNYVYLASGDSELINAQQLRFLFVATPPLAHEISSIVNLNTGTWRVETGILDQGDSFAIKVLRNFQARTVGLAATNPTLRVDYRTESDYTAAAGFSTLVSYNLDSTAETGTDFAASITSRTPRLQFRGTGNATSNTYAVLMDAQVKLETLAERVSYITFVAEAADGTISADGAPAPVTANQVSDAMNTWIAATDLATITDWGTNDSYTCQLEDFTIEGMGHEMELTIVAREAVG